MSSPDITPDELDAMLAKYRERASDLRASGGDWEELAARELECRCEYFEALRDAGLQLLRAKNGDSVPICELGALLRAEIERRACR